MRIIQLLYPFKGLPERVMKQSELLRSRQEGNGSLGRIQGMFRGLNMVLKFFPCGEICLELHCCEGLEEDLNG